MVRRDSKKRVMREPSARWAWKPRRMGAATMVLDGTTEVMELTIWRVGKVTDLWSTRATTSRGRNNVEPWGDRSILTKLPRIRYLHLIGLWN
jgi:hypothetical protein